MLVARAGRRKMTSLVARCSTVRAAPKAFGVGRFQSGWVLLIYASGNYFDSTYEEEWGREAWRTRWSLWCFPAEMEVDAAQVEIPAKNESGKEGDADVVATFEPLGTIIHVPAEKHTGKTGDWAVQQIKDYRDRKVALLNEANAMDDGYSRIARVISTAEFSPECSSLARQNKVLPLNGREFVQLLLNAEIEGLDTAFTSF